MLRPIVVCALVATQLSGCLEEKMKAMVGKTTDELVMEWGPPTQIADAREGGQIWVYVQSGAYTVPGQGSTTTEASARRVGRSVYGAEETRTTVTPPQSINVTLTVTFLVDKDGRVTRYAWHNR